MEFLAATRPVLALIQDARLKVPPVRVSLRIEGACPGERTRRQAQGALTDGAQFEGGEQNGTAEVEDESGQCSSSVMVTMSYLTMSPNQPHAPHQVMKMRWSDIQYSVEMPP